MKTTTKTILLLFLSTFLCASCSKNDDNEPDNSNTTSGTVTDADGNVYHTVTIGTQTWLVENLKTTKYNDGVTIPNVTDNTTWSNLTTGAYCNYNNDAANGTNFGRLYNWHTVNTGKLAPKGWHIPTDIEWTTLCDYLGGNDVAGGKMKSATGWGSEIGTTNSSGFSALPSGGIINAKFSNINVKCYFWSTTENIDSDVWYRTLISEQLGIYRNISYGSKNNGFAVRCIKN